MPDQSPFGRDGKYAAIRECRLAAKAGDGEAQYWLGVALLHGRWGVAIDTGDGLRMLRCQNGSWP